MFLCLETKLTDSYASYPTCVDRKKEGKNKWCHCSSILSLSLSPTHTHTHTLSLTLSLAFCQPFLPSLYHCLDFVLFLEGGWGRKPKETRALPCLTFSCSSKGEEPTESYGAALLFYMVGQPYQNPIFFSCLPSSSPPSSHYFVIIDFARGLISIFFLRTWVFPRNTPPSSPKFPHSRLYHLISVSHHGKKLSPFNEANLLA